MIRALVTGQLFGEPQRRTSQAGKEFTTGKVRVDGKDGAAVWTSVIAFGELGERLATLRANQAVAISGKAELTAWAGKDTHAGHEASHCFVHIFLLHNRGHLLKQNSILSLNLSEPIF